MWMNKNEIHLRMKTKYLPFYISSILLLAFSLFSLTCHANQGNINYIFKKVDHQQGLSNSAVLCLFQDDEGLMWFGTYDGVNCWDGKTMEIYRSDFSKDRTLSNNVIHSISQADDHCLWIDTHLGINRFSQKFKRVVANYDFNGDYYIHSNAKGETWTIAEDGLYYFNTHHQNFIRTEKLVLPIDSMERRAFVGDDGTLWLFPLHSGQIHHYSLNSFATDSMSVKSSLEVENFHSKQIKTVFYQSGVFNFIDSDNDLYMYDISRKTKIYIRNLSSLVNLYGNIVGIVTFYEDIIVAFRSNGLLRLRASRKYEEEIVDRNIRVYSLYREPRQGLLWIASDGQGAVMYAKKYSVATNLMLSRMSVNLSRQVRSLMTDKYGNLWLGTKGDGVLCVPNYTSQWNNTVVNAHVYFPGKKQESLSYIKWNKEFHVYKLLQSRYRSGFWIGAGSPGLYYYAYDQDKVLGVDFLSGKPVIEIHDIYEQNDSVLFVASAGEGFYKLILEKQGDKVCVREQKRYRFFHDQQDISMFYPMLSEGDSLLWLGSREKGLVRFDMRTEEYLVISLKERLKKSVDDILSLHRAKDGNMYIGTTSGLVSLAINGNKFEAHYIGREQGLLNDMIHGVLEDGNGFLWLSTNRGLIKYNPLNGSSHDYYYSGGVQVGEFSDDAYYLCPYTGRLFFGGIDGLLYLENEVAVAPDFYPGILFRRFWIGRKEISLGDCLSDDGKSLNLSGKTVSFSLSFAVPDYLTGEETEYSFILEGHDKDWSIFSSSNEASYVEVPYGDYVFKVRYKKDVFDTDYKLCTMPIRISPPWYLSLWAYIFYILILLVLGSYLFYLLRRYFLHEQILKRLMLKESKSGISVDNMDTRSLVDSFTLIYNACDYIRAENATYVERCKQVDLIREISMNMLFRPEILQTERIKQFYPTIFVLSAQMCVKKISEEVINVLQTEGYDTTFLHGIIPGELSYPIYPNALRCILYYCYRSLCSYTALKDVTITAELENDKMKFTFISDHNAAIEELYRQLVGTSSVSTCNKHIDDRFGMQVMLGFVQSALHQLQVEIWQDTIKEEGKCFFSLQLNPATLHSESSKEQKTLLLLEDRDEMIWLITGLLSEQYSVVAVRNVQAAFDEIRNSVPAVFLVDMFMYANEENVFMEYIGKNRSLLSKTAFIPMLVWTASSAVQRELIKWSDSYIVLPYDILFLKEVIYTALYGKKEGKQIYLEDLGDWGAHIVCTTAEQADFMRKLLQVIEQNLSHEDLGSTFLAERMAMSSRQFYRKFKEISSLPPSDLIKNYRMEKAARLLREEDLSIQDVIMEVGISSRSYFYKEFVLKFGVTPKEYREQYKS